MLRVNLRGVVVALILATNTDLLAHACEHFVVSGQLLIIVAVCDAVVAGCILFIGTPPLYKQRNGNDCLLYTSDAADE